VGWITAPRTDKFSEERKLQEALKPLQEGKIEVYVHESTPPWQDGNDKFGELSLRSKLCNLFVQPILFDAFWKVAEAKDGADCMLDLTFKEDAPFELFTVRTEAEVEERDGSNSQVTSKEDKAARMDPLSITNINLIERMVRQPNPVVSEIIALRSNLPPSWVWVAAIALLTYVAVKHI
jgi:hypothetical protein